MIDRLLSTVPGTLDGYLMQWRSAAQRNVGTLASAFLNELGKVSEVQRCELSLPRGWHAFNVVSEFSLQPSSDPPQLDFYTYFLLVRIQPRTGSVILASTSRALVRSIIETYINKAIRPALVSVQILVGDLARKLVFVEDAPFRMTSFSGEFNSDGANLRTMILYGDDLANADFVRKNIHLVTASQVGMREPASLREDARIGSAGNLRFYYRDGIGLRSLEKCLSFISVSGLYVTP